LRRWLWLGGGLLGCALVLTALAPRASAFRAIAARGGHAFGHHGRGGLAAHLMDDPQAAKEHVGTASEFVLRGVNATADQKAKTRQITDRVVDQLVPLAEKHRELHHTMVAEMAKPQIDRAAIEKVRQDGLALADEASRIAIDGIADIGEVLTPEQRKDLIELGKRLHGHGPTR
jgi:Spy/CpxP family protein refolding chaperone